MTQKSQNPFIFMQIAKCSFVIDQDFLKIIIVLSTKSVARHWKWKKNKKEENLFKNFFCEGWNALHFISCLSKCNNIDQKRV